MRRYAGRSRVGLLHLHMPAGGIDRLGCAAHTPRMGNETRRTADTKTVEALREKILAVVADLGEVSAGRLRSEVGRRGATTSVAVTALLNDGKLVVTRNGSQVLYRLAAGHGHQKR